MAAAGAWRRIPTPGTPIRSDRCRRICSALLTVIEDSGHLSTVEQAEAVTAALVRWLQATSPQNDG